MFLTILTVGFFRIYLKNTEDEVNRALTLIDTFTLTIEDKKYVYINYDGQNWYMGL